MYSVYAYEKLTSRTRRCTVCAYMQLEEPSVLRQLQDQPMSTSQRQTIVDLLSETLLESSDDDDDDFNPTLFARYRPAYVTADCYRQTVLVVMLQ